MRASTAPFTGPARILLEITADAVREMRLKTGDVAALIESTEVILVRS